MPPQNANSNFCVVLLNLQLTQTGADLDCQETQHLNQINQQGISIAETTLTM